MHTTNFVTIALAAEQLKAAKRLAKKHSRTMSELFRGGLRRLEQEERQRQAPASLAGLGSILRAIQQYAKGAGLDKMSNRQIAAAAAKTEA